MTDEHEEPTGRALALSGSQAMAVRLAEMNARTDLMRTFISDAMVQGTDYGEAPGQRPKPGERPKMMLFKPGAEKLCELYGFAIRLGHIEREREGDHLRATVTVSLVRKDDGEVVAEGIGEANTYESRYRWRWVYANQVPPGLNKDALMQRSFESGAKQFRVENDDLAALHNTVLKMAKKRALVDAVLSATRSSGMFEDAEGGHDGDAPAGGAIAAPGGRGAKGRDELTQFWSTVKELGYSKDDVEQLAGKPVEETTPDDRRSVLVSMQSARAEGQPK